MPAVCPHANAATCRLLCSPPAQAEEESPYLPEDKLRTFLSLAVLVAGIALFAAVMLPALQQLEAARR